MVKLRFKRFGRLHTPHYRLAAIDSRSPRQGEPIEEVGIYNPCEKDPAKVLVINTDRVKYWLSVGAQPSQVVRDLLAKAGVITKAPFKASRNAKPKKKVVEKKEGEAAAAEAPKA